jgi:hypothetical protein
MICGSFRAEMLAVPFSYSTSRALLLLPFFCYHCIITTRDSLTYSSLVGSQLCKHKASTKVTPRVLLHPALHPAVQ